MEIERGSFGAIPYAAVGSGAPVVVLAGLYPVTGVASDGLVRGTVAPIRQLTGRRRIIVLNRWSGLGTNVTMPDLAVGYADAIRSGLDGPVDVVGLSTGGSIAQQLAADHPDTVRRLALISTGCRLGPFGRTVQARVAALLRDGSIRHAMSLAAGTIAPAGLRPLARGVGWAAGARILSTPTAAADLIATLDAEDRFDLAACPSPIQKPTLIIAGGRDRFYSVDIFRETARLIHGSHLTLLPRRGHLNVTTDRRATATLAGFLTG